MQNIDKIYYIMYNNKNRYNIIIMFEYFRGGFICIVEIVGNK